MKKIISVLTGILLSTAVSSAFSANLTCPPISQIRDKVALQRAAQIGTPDKSAWGLTSNVFDYSNASWNVILFTTLSGITDPVDAVYLGQRFFDSSILAQPTVLSVNGDHMTCSYSLESFKYRVVAITPANYGVTAG